MIFSFIHSFICGVILKDWSKTIAPEAEKGYE
jgi:hypothetical protein